MSEWKCPVGHGVKIGKFCGKCGRQLVPPSEPVEEPLEVDENLICPNCKFSFVSEQYEFCPGCGHKLLWIYRDDGD